MRYIDADLIVYDHAVARSLDDGHNWNELVVCKDQIDDIPTADVVEVVHGRWIPMADADEDNNQLFQCSNCGGGDLHAVGVEVPFCWKCGARMDGEL